MHYDTTFYRKRLACDAGYSEWKSAQILRMINANQTLLGTNNMTSVCEVGCCTGEILLRLSEHLPCSTTFTGYDVYPDLEGVLSGNQGNEINIICQDFLSTKEYYDLLLAIDVIPHIEDYIGFLRKIKDRATYKLLYIPLELYAARALLGHRYIESRNKYGHIHLFNKDISLAILQDLGYEVVDHFYASSVIDLPTTNKNTPSFSKTAKVFRVLLSRINVDLTARLLGGFSLFVLAM